MIAAFTWDDMAEEGAADIFFPAMFLNAVGSMAEMTPHRSLAHEAVRYVCEAVVWAAKVLKRPVKWRAKRGEEFAAMTAGRV